MPTTVEGENRDLSRNGQRSPSQILYVVCGQDGLITPVELAEDFASGEAGEGFSDPSFASPTTIAKFGNRLLVVNSQFDRRESGESPELPFTVSGVETP
jgi:hypothetical protein